MTRSTLNPQSTLCASAPLRFKIPALQRSMFGVHCSKFRRSRFHASRFLPQPSSRFFPTFFVWLNGIQLHLKVVLMHLNGMTDPRASPLPARKPAKIARVTCASALARKPTQRRPRSEKEIMPMKDLETQQRFVELRTQGWTFARIAAELKVCKRTLVNWSRKFQFEIQNQRAIQLEELEEQLLSSRENRARALAEQLQTVEAELKTRSISELSTSRLFALAQTLRQQILHETGTPRFISPINEIPQDEYHEQVQNWTA